MKSHHRFLCIILAVLLASFIYQIIVLNNDIYQTSRLESDDLMQIKLLDTPNKWLLAPETLDIESEVQNPRGM